MITIKARINLSDNGGTIQTVTSNKDGSKVSSPIANTVGKKTQPQMVYPFFYGLSRFGEKNYTYMSKGAKVPYFMGEQISNSNGEFANPYTITINGSNISHFIITFDTVNGGFPKSITVDGNTIVDDDAQWEIVVDSADTHTITIGNWNKPNSPLIITSVYADVNIEIDRDNLLSFTSDILDRNNVQEPTYGIISNSSNISFNDFTEQALDLITQNLLHSGVATKVYLYNDIKHKQEQICFMYIQSLSYDMDNKQVNLYLKDNLEAMQNINVEAMDYVPNESEPKPLSYIYNKLLAITTSNGFDMQSLGELDTETKNILRNTIIQYPLLESGSLWDEWDKLCQATLSNMYINYVGKIVFKHSV